MKTRIDTPSRLHFSLIDLEGSLGRIDGGIGVALEEPAVVLEAEAGDYVNTNDKLAQSVAKKVLDYYNLDGVKIEVKKTIPPHVGLGSTTQLALAVGVAITKIYDIDVTIRDLAQIVGRGGTSGVGVAAFEKGGFILDGGHKFSEKKDFLPSRFSAAPPPNVLARCDLPDDWQFLCVIPELKGAHGQKEKDIFQKYCPIPRREVEEVSRIILMNVLPGVAEGNINEFGSGINKIQHVGFKKIEVSLQDKIVMDLLDLLRENSHGAGMSSFGPLCFGIFDKGAKSMEKDVVEWCESRGIKYEVFLTKANNKGAKVS